VVEVTTIREGHEFEDLDYPNEEEGIENMKDAKGNFILWPCKDIILKPRSSPIVSLQSKEAEGTPSKMLLPSHDPPSHYSPQQQELLANIARGYPSHHQHHSPQLHELEANIVRGPPSPPQHPPP
jgi:hypothetical protein